MVLLCSALLVTIKVTVVEKPSYLELRHDRWRGRAQYQRHGRIDAPLERHGSAASVRALGRIQRGELTGYPNLILRER